MRRVSRLRKTARSLANYHYRNSLSSAEVGLIEKIAELMQNRALPMLDDIRDESAEDIRIVIEPKSKNMAPEQIMAVLFKQTDLETRFSLT